jgi:hypothetical protein
MSRKNVAGLPRTESGRSWRSSALDCEVPGSRGPQARVDGLQANWPNKGA